MEPRARIHPADSRAPEVVPDFPWSLSPADPEASSREACERFIAGYIQCMHDVHTFVSTCPGIDQTVAAELLNHLMESMPLDEVIPDGLNGPYGGAQGRGAPSASDHHSDLDETESEQNHFSSSEEGESHDLLSFSSLVYSKSPWRPW